MSSQSFALDLLPRNIFEEFLPEILPFMADMCNTSLRQEMLTLSQRNAVAIMPGRGLFAGESSAAPPGTGATLDISVEVFGGPAAKVLGAAATFWSAAAGNSVVSRGNSEETELPDRSFSFSTSEPDLPWWSMLMAATDWRS